MGLHALSYRDFGRQWIGNWAIFCASLHAHTSNPQADQLRNLLMSAPYEQVTVPVPEVFQYGVYHMKPRGFIYRLVFYGGLWCTLSQF